MDSLKFEKMSSKKWRGSLTEKTLSPEEQHAKVLFDFNFQFIVVYSAVVLMNWKPAVEAVNSGYHCKNGNLSIYLLHITLGNQNQNLGQFNNSVASWVSYGFGHNYVSTGFPY